MGDDMHRSKTIVHARRSLFQVAAAAVMLALATSAWAQQMPQGAGQPGSQAAIAPGGAAPPQDPGYKLGPGDHLRINVFNQKDLTGEYLVDGTGLLAFPLIGSVQAGGLTAHELERVIINKLKPDYLRDPNVNVVVLTYRPFYIVGEVKQPGSYPYVSGMTIINAIALAGGFTYRAKESSFYLTRSDKQGHKNRMDASPDTSVQPGDVITVRERYF
jgi:polysaccharide export outer membrane protein